ncbi:hypothetical protein BV898_11131 [Hypsibius exemplaris]|uniref:Uncharacterized protein n=1 Tax=Hypsibius exemplaris TaxID=2072580 RepID=A0A1W0WHE9_HYPEX|nr:hypothetical protein BV898_11131 [Hypsibius exemplaris]
MSAQRIELTNRRADGRKDIWKVGWTDGRKDIWRVGWTDGRKDIWKVGRTDRLSNRRTLLTVTLPWRAPGWTNKFPAAPLSSTPSPWNGGSLREGPRHRGRCRTDLRLHRLPSRLVPPRNCMIGRPPSLTESKVSSTSDGRADLIDPRPRPAEHGEGLTGHECVRVGGPGLAELLTLALLTDGDRCEELDGRSEFGATGRVRDGEDGHVVGVLVATVEGALLAGVSSHCATDECGETTRRAIPRTSL